MGCQETAFGCSQKTAEEAITIARHLIEPGTRLVPVWESLLDFMKRYDTLWDVNLRTQVILLTSSKMSISIPASRPPADMPSVKGQ
jgi:hypothetical protein